MPYVKTINEDGVVSDIMAKAIDPTLDATILKKADLVNGFTQTTPGVNALDAAAGKSLNDSLSNCATKTELANSTFQRISVPSDLNSMTTAWKYTDFPYTSTPTNAPYGAGTVYVFAAMQLLQVMVPYNLEANRFLYIRTRYQNSWGVWQKVAVINA